MLWTLPRTAASLALWLCCMTTLTRLHGSGYSSSNRRVRAMSCHGLNRDAVPQAPPGGQVTITHTCSDEQREAAATAAPWPRHCRTVFVAYRPCSPRLSTVSAHVGCRRAWQGRPQALHASNEIAVNRQRVHFDFIIVRFLRLICIDRKLHAVMPSRQATCSPVTALTIRELYSVRGYFKPRRVAYNCFIHNK